MKAFAIAILCSALLPGILSAEDNVPEGTIAVVLGKPVPEKAMGNLEAFILPALFEKYAKENKLDASQAELEQFVTKLEEKRKIMEADREKQAETLRQELASGKLDEKQKKNAENQLKTLARLKEGDAKAAEVSKRLGDKYKPMMLDMARRFVMSWKIKKSLYDRYGGRVLFQQSGPEPWDALRTFLKEEEAKGSFKILTKAASEKFWNYFTNEESHRTWFMKKEEADKCMATPWWLMDKPLR